MPYALLIIGAVLLVAGIRNTYGDLWTLVEGDFTRQNGYLTWVAAIAVVGAIGYIPKLKPLSVAFMTLLLVVLVLSNGGVFARLQQFIASGAGGRGAAPIPNSATVSPTAPVGNAPSAVEQVISNLGNIH
jgi:hypothetical protein